MENAYADDASDTVQQIEDDFDLDVEVAGADQLDFGEDFDGYQKKQDPALFFEDSPHGPKKVTIEDAADEIP